MGLCCKISSTNFIAVGLWARDSDRQTHAYRVSYIPVNYIVCNVAEGGFDWFISPKFKRPIIIIIIAYN